MLPSFCCFQRRLDTHGPYSSVIYRHFCLNAWCSEAATFSPVSRTLLRCLTPCAGLYNITAEYSGSSDGHYQPSVGSEPFKIGISSPPVQWGIAS